MTPKTKVIYHEVSPFITVSWAITVGILYPHALFEENHRIKFNPQSCGIVTIINGLNPNDWRRYHFNTSRRPTMKPIDSSNSGINDNNNQVNESIYNYQCDLICSMIPTVTVIYQL